jgi:outer membrane receptor protein involved in Fe transport
MLRKARFISSLVMLLVACAGSAAQVTGGRVTGTVVDADGSAVAQATVSLRHEATGHVVNVQTNDAGAFNFPNVAVGRHTMTVEAAGFEPARRELTVALNQESAADVALGVAGLAEAVEVTAASEALVQTDSSQLSRAYDARAVLGLPIFGDQNALALLSPNVVEQPAGSPGAGGSVGGARPRGNGFSVDGVDNNDPVTTGPSVRVIQDAVAEFSVLTNNYGAEFGTGAGGQFNTVTRSGGEEFRGSAFGYFQNQRLRAASTLEEEQLRAGLLGEKPPFENARWGGSYGGPVVGNDLFFFAALQRETRQQATAPAKYGAPTEEGFRQIAALPGASPYVVNLLRSHLAPAPVAARTMTVLGAGGVPFGDVIVNTPAGSAETLAQVNFDHLPGARDQFRYRFSFQRTRAEQAGFGPALFNNLAAYDARLFSATWVRAVGGNAFNDLRLAYRRMTEDYPLKDARAADFPNISVAAANLSLGPQLTLPQGSPVNNYYQLYDAASVLRGPHAFKFGGEYRRLIFSTRFVQLSRGYYDYADLDQLLRDEAPQTNLRGVGSGSFAGNLHKFYGFAQDDWKVTPNLTLNLGARYEYTTLPRDLAAQELNSAASLPGVIEFRRPRTDRNNFAPRVGLAYSPGFEGGILNLLFGEGGRSALRANFAVSYYEHFQNLTLTSLPPQFTQTLDITASASAFGFDPRRPFLENGGVPARLAPVTNAAEARASTGALIPDQTTPYSTAWALSYQREVSRSLVFEARYLGTRGRKLPVQLRLNAGLVNEENLIIPTFLTQPDPEQLSGLPTLGQVRAMPGTNLRRLQEHGFGTSPLTSYQFAASSQYDAASFGLTRRAARGLALTAAYTWSRTFDDATNELNSSTPNPRRPQDHYDLSAEWSRSALDIPHRFAASFNYEVPFFGRPSNRWLRAALGGFELGGVFQAQSGQPVTVLSGRDANLNFDSVGDRAIFNPAGARGTSSAVRPVNALGQVVPFGNNATVAYVAVNPDAQYIQAGQGARATAGRNSLRTRGFNRTDLTLLKNFRLTEDRFSLQFGAEVFNLLNQRIRTLAGLGEQTGAAATGFVTAGSPAFNDYGVGNYAGRSVQLRAKLSF